MAFDTPAAGQAARASAPRRGISISVIWKKRLSSVLWSIASISLFAGIWELAWFYGYANPLLLPPPHMFLSDIPGMLKYFAYDNTVGNRGGEGDVGSLLMTAFFTIMRVGLGLFFGFTIGVGIGVAVHYLPLARKLLMPLILMLAPISPIAWLPVALFLFGIGDVPAIFLVFITLFFAIVLSTSAQIESVPKNYIHVARIMGANRNQTFWRVVFPAILPSLFMTIRLNLFGAWMIVLVAEAVGVGTGLGQITSMARATFNSQLVFFTMAIIGLLGFLSDWLLRYVQRRMLWWVNPAGVVL
jgi:NitT/TauT family transport system permease protein